VKIITSPWQNGLGREKNGKVIIKRISATLTWDSVDRSERSQHADGANGGQTEVLRVNSIFQRAGTFHDNIKTYVNKTQ